MEENEVLNPMFKEFLIHMSQNGFNAICIVYDGSGDPSILVVDLKKTFCSTGNKHVQTIREANCQRIAKVAYPTLQDYKI